MNDIKRAEQEGRKDDLGKVPLHLLPFDALYGISAVLEFGAKKYGDRNWEKGMAWSRIFRACISHLFQWFMRYPYDEETKITHLAHAGCCILFLIAYEHRRIGTDDRPGLPKA